MTFIRKIICRLTGHTRPRLFAIGLEPGEEVWICRDCLEAWREYNTTGTHHQPAHGPEEAT